MRIYVMFNVYLKIIMYLPRDDISFIKLHKVGRPKQLIHKYHKILVITIIKILTTMKTTIIILFIH